MPDYETYTEDDEDDHEYWVIDPEEADEYELEGCLISQELNLLITQAFSIIAQVEDDDLVVILPDHIKEAIAQLIARSIRHEYYNQPLKVLKG